MRPCGISDGQPADRGVRSQHDRASSRKPVERPCAHVSHDLHQPRCPDDNAFTVWLGAKRAALGYEVWADVLRLRGGGDWQRKLE